ncbi:MAG: glycosyltransferase family 1 protein [Coleofasciculus sp. C1-SOL-03]|uniref:glycosyltransferase family 4 protein n=1 Tax=Coleofasciculus sp. C1-SOL-03 TaxID=3069522 RepID=UPI0032FD5B4C
MEQIVIDVTPLSIKPSGISFYIANLIRCLSTLQYQENFELALVYQPRLRNWLCCRLEFPNSLSRYSNCYFLPLPVRITNIILDYFPQIFSSHLAHYLDSPTLIHGTNYTVFPYPNSLKVMTIYDLTFIKYPHYIDSVVKTYSRRVKKCLKWADLVITISESSKNDIIKYLNVNPDRIHVTSLASRYSCDHLLIPPNSSVNYDFFHPYILFVSTIEPRKNVTTLISAFNYLKQKHKIEHHLILIGQKGWYYKPIFAAIDNSPWTHHIHHLNYLSDEDVAFFYSKADVFAYPSHYEGFGLPVLEAMTLGTPVVTSNTSSLPEVAGDAALLINPNDPIQLAEAILKIISDTQLCQDLIQKGKERAKLFSWEKTAKETLNAYKSLLSS